MLSSEDFILPYKTTLVIVSQSLFSFFQNKVFPYPAFSIFYFFLKSHNSEIDKCPTDIFFLLTK